MGILDEWGRIPHTGIRKNQTVAIGQRQPCMRRRTGSKSVSTPFTHANLLSGPFTGFHTGVFTTSDPVRSSQIFSVTWTPANKRATSGTKIIVRKWVIVRTPLLEELYDRRRKKIVTSITNMRI